VCAPAICTRWADRTSQAKQASANPRRRFNARTVGMSRHGRREKTRQAGSDTAGHCQPNQGMKRRREAVWMQWGEGEGGPPAVPPRGAAPAEEGPVGGVEEAHHHARRVLFPVLARLLLQVLPRPDEEVVALPEPVALEDAVVVGARDLDVRTVRLWEVNAWPRHVLDAEHGLAEAVAAGQVVVGGARADGGVRLAVIGRFAGLSPAVDVVDEELDPARVLVADLGSNGIKPSWIYLQCRLPVTV
jgi:hypothetical protein